MCYSESVNMVWFTCDSGFIPKINLGMEFGDSFLFYQPSLLCADSLFLVLLICWFIIWSRVWDCSIIVPSQTVESFCVDCCWESLFRAHLCWTLAVWVLDATVNTALSFCLVAQSCPTLCDPLHCSPPGFSVHGISQARILEWVAGSFSRGSPCPRDPTQVSCTGRRILFHWATTLFLKMRMGFSWSCFPRQRVCANPSTYSSFLYS